MVTNLYQSTELFYYRAFDLVWALPFECPELRPFPPHPSPDIHIQLGDVPESLTDARPAGPLMQVRPGKILFSFPDVARYLVLGDNKIITQPAGEVDHQVRLFLLGTVSALLLMQRGLLSLHASGIVTPKGAVLFAGHSGYGKSTLLASFMARGYPMITDDVAAIRLDDAGAVVLPSFPNMKMWADSLARFGQDTAVLKPARDPNIDKFSVPVTSELATEPVPLHAVYALRPKSETAVRLEPLTHAKKFNVFLDHTWQKMALKRQGRHVTHFQQVTAVANQVRVVRTHRPMEPFLLDELTDAIEADFLA